MEETEFEALTPLAPSIRELHHGRLVRAVVRTGLFIQFCYCNQETSPPPGKLDSTCGRESLLLREKALSFSH